MSEIPTNPFTASEKITPYSSIPRYYDRSNIVEKSVKFQENNDTRLEDSPIRKASPYTYGKENMQNYTSMPHKRVESNLIPSLNNLELSNNNPLESNLLLYH